MPVSQREVKELRREGLAQSLGNGRPPALETMAEIIGFMVQQMRASEYTEPEMYHDIELVLRAAEVDREDLRAALGTLKALNYPPGLIKLLTSLARKAMPKQLYCPPGWNPSRRRLHSGH